LAKILTKDSWHIFLWPTVYYWDEATALVGYALIMMMIIE